MVRFWRLWRLVSTISQLFFPSGDPAVSLLSTLMGWLSDRLGRWPPLIASCIGYAVLRYPFFLMASSGSVGLAIVAQLLMVLL